MSVHAWITLAVIVVLVAALVSNRVKPAPGLFCANAALMLAGVTSFNQAIGPIASSAPVSVAAFYVLAAAVEKTAGLQPLLRHMFDRGAHPRVSLARLTVPVAVLSGFVSNTPIVAMLIGPVRSWGARTGIRPSKLLIPLSYASILGGSLTLIGTSTNLVASELADQAGIGALSMFSFAKIGIPVVVVGLTTVILAAPRLLPNRGGDAAGDDGEVRAYMVVMVIENGGRLCGSSIIDAGLDHLDITHLRRDDEIIDDPDPDVVLRAGDRLSLLAGAQQVVALQQTAGLTPTTQDDVKTVDSTTATFYEVVLGPNSPLVGSTIMRSGFRDRYDAAVIAIYRAGSEIGSDHLRREVLAEGDTVLLLAERGFARAWHSRTDFLLVNRLGGPPPQATKQAPITLGILAAVVIVTALGFYSIAEAAIGGVIALVALRVLTSEEAAAAVDWSVVIMIGAALGIGAAVTESGLATTLADLVVTLTSHFGTFGAVLILLIATAVLTEVISNAAAIVLVFPIAMSIAAQVGLDPTTTAIGVSIVAGSSFITPVGYQTNTMVYGPGNYRFGDYARLGLPLATLVILTVTSAIVILG